MDKLEDSHSSLKSTAGICHCDLQSETRLTLSSLPHEILQMVLSNFCDPQPKTLALCAQVSKEIAGVAIPLLWSTVHVKNRKNLDRFMTPEARQGLIKNSERIRKLVIVGKDMLDLFIPHHSGILTDSNSERTLFLQPPPVTCTNLVNLVVAIYKEQENHFTKKFLYYYEQTLSANMERGIIGIARQSSRLKSIKIANKMSPATVLAIAHGASLTLQELEFRSSISAQTTKSLLKDLPQHITKLHLSGIEDGYRFEFLDKDNGETPFIDANDIEDAPINHHALTSLHLRGDLEGHEEYILLPFLTTCSARLTNFQTTGIGCYKNKKVHDALARLNIYMETIHFQYDSGYDETVEDAEIAAIFALSQHLKVVDLYLCPNTGPQAIAAILQSAAYLKCLHLPCHNQVSAVDLQAIISQAKKLRTLIMYFPGMRCGTLPSLSLSAAEFLAADWASSSLERFGCVFRVPRPNDHVPQEHQDPTWNNPALEHSHNIQRQVYRHLAKQTQLYEVYLGASLGDEENPQHLWYSLEMTLESGLDELEGLKNLHTLTLHNMNHRMGIKELGWTCLQWPELRSIDGFCPNRGQLPSDIEDWRNEQLESVHRHKKESCEEQLFESARRYSVAESLF